jgi:hypothetical protein
MNRIYGWIFLGAFLITLFFYQTGFRGVSLRLEGYLALVLFGFFIGRRAKWTDFPSGVLLSFCAFWLGLVPLDVYYGLELVFRGASGCIGGFGWGIADGLWSWSLITTLFIVFGHLTKADTPGNQNSSRVVGITESDIAEGGCF